MGRDHARHGEHILHSAGQALRMFAARPAPESAAALRLFGAVVAGRALAELAAAEEGSWPDHVADGRCAGQYGWRPRPPRHRRKAGSPHERGGGAEPAASGGWRRSPKRLYGLADSERMALGGGGGLERRFVGRAYSISIGRTAHTVPSHRLLLSRLQHFLRHRRAERAIAVLIRLFAPIFVRGLAFVRSGRSNSRSAAVCGRRGRDHRPARAPRRQTLAVATIARRSS